MSCLVRHFSVGISGHYVNNLLVSSCRRFAAALDCQCLGALGDTFPVTGWGSVSRGGPALLNWSKMSEEPYRIPMSNRGHQVTWSFWTTAASQAGGWFGFKSSWQPVTNCGVAHPFSVLWICNYVPGHTEEGFFFLVPKGLQVSKKVKRKNLKPHTCREDWGLW